MFELMGIKYEDICVIEESYTSIVVINNKTYKRWKQFVKKKKENL